MAQNIGDNRMATGRPPAIPSSNGFTPERALELVLCVTALVFLSPLFVILAVLIKLHDGGPMLFRHSRVGHNGQFFDCLKFRSMAVDAEKRLAVLLQTDHQARAEWKRDHKLKSDPRITPLGRFLRKSSLDELPQLFNVLRGEMSLVGPRPIVAAEIRRYGHYFKIYCSVRPGITGLWQISGRSVVDYRRRVAMDVLYVRRRTWLLDMKILVCTIPAVLLRRGAY